MNQKDHWQQVYSTKMTEKLGWYKPHLQTSLNWIKELGLAAEAPIIDVGGGSSTLVDDLLGAGHQSITVLDISDRALCTVRERLGEKAKLVTWINNDITSVVLPNHHYELWHDRAVFHFLTEADQQRKYLENLLEALRPCGHLIIGTCASEAQPKFIGLPVQRYNLKQLTHTLGAEFELVRHHKEEHLTPGVVVQMYLYCHFRKTV